MATWEYKVISSGKGGFASPSLLEQFLNELGKDEWQIIDFRPAEDNPLAFTGLARRGVQRDWTLEAEAAAQAREEQRRKREEEHRREEERIAAEKEATQAATRAGSEEVEESDPESAGFDPWDEFDLEDELPTLLDAIKPHLRKNPKGLGEAAAIEYIAKKWGQESSDVLGALEECGIEAPESAESSPVYFDFEGDLFWLNVNNRGQLFINVREKPRPKFKTTKMQRVADDDPAAEDLREEHAAEKERRQKKAEEKAAREAAAVEEAAKTAEPLPDGLALLDLLKDNMRRNRRGPGMSGSISYLAKALKHPPEALLEALGGIDLSAPVDMETKPSFVEHGGELFWMKQDARGGIWINCKDADKAKKKATKKADAESAENTAEMPETEPASEESAEITFAPGPNAVSALRLLLKPKSRGTGEAATIDDLAERLGKAAGEILDVLVEAGLAVPDSSEDKPTFIELGEEVLWLNRNKRTDVLWLNAKVKPKRKTAIKKAATKKAPAKKTAKKKAESAED